MKFVDINSLSHFLNNLKNIFEPKGSLEAAVKAANTYTDNSVLTPTEKTLIVSMLRNSLYTTPVKDSIDALEVSFGLNYSIINNLSNVVTNNPVAITAKDCAYNATLTAYNGMEIKSVVVKMGGVDITNECYKDGLIKIEAVTGNIEITAIAKANLYLELVQGQIVGSKPYYSSNTKRASYVGLECLVTPNKTYRLVGVDGINYGVHTITTNGYEKVKQNLAITGDVDKFDSGWQNNGYTFTAREDAVCVWITARKPNESDIVPNDAMPVYIEEVI